MVCFIKLVLMWIVKNASYLLLHIAKQKLIYSWTLSLLSSKNYSFDALNKISY